MPVQPVLVEPTGDTRLTVACVEDWLKGIEFEAMVGDDESAHSTEDTMRDMVLRCIAEGRVDDPAAVAAAAMKSGAIEFQRWCA